MKSQNRPSQDTLRALETAPGMFLVLSPEFNILTASNQYLEVTKVTRADITGRYIFDAFPENPELPRGEGIEILLSSLREVLASGERNFLPVQRYDIEGGSAKGTFMVRYWEILHEPVFDDAGAISYIIQAAKDVTEEVVSRLEAEVSRENEEESLRELEQVHQSLRIAHDELQELNQTLEIEVEKRTAELERSERKYRNLIEHSPVAIQVFRGADMTFELVNESMLNFLGKTKDIIGKPLFVGVPEIIGQPIVEVLYGVFKTGKPFDLYAEKVILERNGKKETGYYDVIYRALYDDGQISGVLGIAIDVTSQILAQQAIMESEERFRNMAESSDIFISLVDTQGMLEYLNGAWADMTGWKQENLSSLSWEEFIHPEDRQTVTEKFIYAMENKQEFVNEFRLLNKQNDYRWLRIKGMPRIDSSKSFKGYIFSGIDVTDERQRLLEIEHINKALVYSNEQLFDTNLKLLESEENLLTAFDAGELGSCSLNLKTGQAEMSERYRHLYGLPLEGEISWEMVLEAVEPEFIPEVNTVLENAVKYGTAVDSTYAIRHLSTGERKWMRVVGKVYQDPNGTNERVYAVVMDITPQKEDELRKNDFIAMVSHELKTPLTSINAYVQLLQLKTSRGKGYDGSAIFDKMQGQLKKMTGMINGFLSVSRLESGKIHLVKQKFDIAHVIDLLVDEYKTVISTHSFAYQPCKGIYVEADEDKIEHILGNLLSNAVKYSPNDTQIEINCEVTDDQVIVSVKDRGMGIHPQDMPKLFDRYYRVQNPQTSTISGFGIGLYLCAEIITSHTGKIWVESEPGEGSVFYFSLPACHPPV